MLELELIEMLAASEGGATGETLVELNRSGLVVAVCKVVVGPHRSRDGPERYGRRGTPDP